MQPQITSCEANDALSALFPRMQEALGDNLLGLYLYGSAVWGDFDEGISDLDLLAVVQREIAEADLPALHTLHDGFVTDFPQWNDRIEVQYFTPDALAHFRERASPMANISPGEPLHIITSGAEWLSNWYFVQEYGFTLFGPAPDTFIPAIDHVEFLAVVLEYADHFGEHIADYRGALPGQGYAIMTLCRSLYTTVHGKQVSKHKAAAWVAATWPEEAEIIADAFVWRTNFRHTQPAAEVYFPRTEAFVQRMLARIPAKPN